MLIKNARIVAFDRSNRILDDGAVRIAADGSISAVGTLAEVAPSVSAGEESLDAAGRLLMPALINAHTHLYSTLARGIALRGKPPKNFPEILKKLWWRLDCALDLEDVYWSALVGLIDYAKSGVGTLVDHHSSPNACAGSLDRIEQAFREVGLRGCLCYETTDRNGREKSRAGFEENVRFLERHPPNRQGKATDGLIHGHFGLHASFTLTDRTLAACREADRSLRGGFHIHVAEDACDVRDARRRYRKSVVERLTDLGILYDRSLAAHCVHVTPADIRRLARRAINVVHNPQSNCNNAVGTAALIEMVKAGVLVGIGSDGYSPRLWEEFKTAFHLQKIRKNDPRVAYAEAYAAAFVNNREILRKIWGLELGRVEAGARADLILVDYFPPTPLLPDNLFGHLLFGISNAPVDTLMVNGRLVVRHKECITVDERAIAGRARERARALWERF